MHDIKFIRNNPEKFQKQMDRRGLKVNISSILTIDKLIRTKQAEIQVIQEKRNNSSKEIGKLISEGKDVSDVRKNISDLKSDLTKLDHEIKKYSDDLNDVLKVLPNSLDDDVPDGDNENENMGTQIKSYKRRETPSDEIDYVYCLHVYQRYLLCIIQK